MFVLTSLILASSPLKDFGTVQGQRIQISSAGAALKINNATVIKADIPASNGVIHVIDTVLLPR